IHNLEGLPCKPVRPSRSNIECSGPGQSSLAIAQVAHQATAILAPTSGCDLLTDISIGCNKNQFVPRRPQSIAPGHKNEQSPFGDKSSQILRPGSQGKQHNILSQDDVMLPTPNKAGLVEQPGRRFFTSSGSAERKLFTYLDDNLSSSNTRNRARIEASRV